MSYKPVNTQTTFVDASIFLPDDDHQLRLKLTDSLRDFATGINTREIGQYYLNELLTGSMLFNTTNIQKPRSIYRKVINFGALPNTLSKPIAHGLTITKDYQFLKMYVVGNNSTGAPFYAITLPDRNSTITIDANNVNITTFADYSAYTNSAVVLEYSKA
jgi:hypothetical protein